MARFISLGTLKHSVITPLQIAWQSARITKRFPNMAPVIEAFDQRYPHVGATTSVSLTERDQKGWDSDALTYGETRWLTFLEVLDAVELRPGERFLDLGCGAGFLCFLAAQGYGLDATGVDVIDTFVTHANDMAQELGLEKQLRFKSNNFFDLEFLPYDIFYATCTCFPEDFMEALSHKFEEVESGSRIITVTDPVQGPHIRQLKQIKAKFNWGSDTVYIAERR